MFYGVVANRRQSNLYENRGVVLIILHGRSRMAIDLRIPTKPGRSTSGFDFLIACTEREICVCVWGYSFAACLSNSNIDHASLWRRSTVPAPNRDISDTWALITVLQNMTYLVVMFCYIYPLPVSPPVAIIYLLG